MLAGFRSHIRRREVFQVSVCVVREIYVSNKKCFFGVFDTCYEA